MFYPTELRACHDFGVFKSLRDGFFSSVKSETADRFASCGDAKMELFDYIDAFYNRMRRHSHLGGVSPEQFEAAQKPR